jgi:hypothetical protein
VTYWFSIPVGACVSVLAFICSAFFLGTAPSYFDSSREDQLISELSASERQLGILLELNREQVLRYHDIVTKQADQSFRAGQLAAAAGLVVIGVCLWVGLNHPGADVKWFSGAIAGTGTAVAGYINRTYMRMYEKSIEQLSQYFDQPVVTGYYLTAERMAKVADLSPDLRDRIIGSVLSTAMHITKKRGDEESLQEQGKVKDSPQEADTKEG